MKFLTYTPKPPLSDFVDFLWLAKRLRPRHCRERLLPTGTAELIIDLRDDAAQGPLIAGPQSQSFVIGTEEQAEVMGVHFKFGGVFPFLGLPAGEVHNRHEPLDIIWGKPAVELHERLLDCNSHLAKFRILEQFLFAQSRQELKRHPAVVCALRKFQAVPSPSIKDVTGRIGLSQRRFIQIFHDEVGMTPKLFCRIQRFQSSLRVINCNDTDAANTHLDTKKKPGLFNHNNKCRVNWANVALSCGYYDQAHFINEFQFFSAQTPTAYLRDRTEHFNHVPIVDG